MIVVAKVELVSIVVVKLAQFAPINLVMAVPLAVASGFFFCKYHRFNPQVVPYQSQFNAKPNQDARSSVPDPEKQNNQRGRVKTEMMSFTRL